MYRLKQPFRFRAQNQRNREGYGWEWDWSGGIGDYIEGTQYGETTDYIIAGVLIHSNYQSIYDRTYNGGTDIENDNVDLISIPEIYISNNPRICSNCKSECKYQYINYTKLDDSLHKVNVAICSKCGRRHIRTNFYKTFIHSNKYSNLKFIKVNEQDNSDKVTDTIDVEDNIVSHKSFKLTSEDEQLILRYHNLSSHDKKIVDYIIGMEE